MPRTSEDVELAELMRRLKKLEAKFPKSGSEGTTSGKEDGFPELEEQFIKRLENAKEMVKSLSTASETVTVTETIRQRRDVHNEVTGIADVVKKMRDTIIKEKKRRAKFLQTGKGLSPEELTRRETKLQAFAQMLQDLERQLRRDGDDKMAMQEAEAKYLARTTISQGDLFGMANAAGGNRGPLSAAEMAGIGFDHSSSGGTNGLTGEQSQAYAEIQRRDQEQDQIIEEIHAVILETGQIAEAINETVEMQKKLLDSVSQHVEQTQDKLDSVNMKLRKTLEERGMSWERMCMVFVCLCLILGMVGVIINQVQPNIG
jgi:t-SNARE complex subunit (syntaxin)